LKNLELTVFLLKNKPFFEFLKLLFFCLLKKIVTNLSGEAGLSEKIRFFLKDKKIS